jgi:hypothetical protein
VGTPPADYTILILGLPVRYPAKANSIQTLTSLANSAQDMQGMHSLICPIVDEEEVYYFRLFVGILKNWPMCHIWLNFNLMMLNLRYYNICFTMFFRVGPRSMAWYRVVINIQALYKEVKYYEFQSHATYLLYFLTKK